MRVLLAKMYLYAVHINQMEITFVKLLEKKNIFYIYLSYAIITI